MKVLIDGEWHEYRVEFAEDYSQVFVRQDGTPVDRDSAEYASICEILATEAQRLMTPRNRAERRRAAKRRR